MTRTAIRWQKWLRNFNFAMTGFNITSQKRKRALLLFYGGTELQDLFETLPNTGNDNDYDAAVSALNDNIIPKTNKQYETIIFQQCMQATDETINQYLCRLRQQASLCKFTNPDKEIAIQLIKGCTSDNLKQKAMQHELTLDKLLEIAQAQELTRERQKNLNMVNMVNERNTVNKLTTARLTQNTNSNKGHTHQGETQTCYLCGGSYPHTSGQSCPAHGTKCKFCGKLNHFETVCRSKKKLIQTLDIDINQGEQKLNTEASDKTENLNHIQVNHNNSEGYVGLITVYEDEPSDNLNSDNECTSSHNLH